MLKLSSAITDRSVLSIRTGTIVGQTSRTIINPNNLKIEGWFIKDKFNGKELILTANDVRDIVLDGIIIDDYEVLSERSDLIRLEEVIKIKFNLIDKLVTTESGKRIGKISDFAVDADSLIIKKIYVAQNLIKNFSGGTITIDRTQIIEITDRRIIVEEPTEQARVQAVPNPAS